MSYVLPFAGNVLRAAAPYVRAGMRAAPYIRKGLPYARKAAKYGSYGAVALNSFRGRGKVVNKINVRTGRLRKVNMKRGYQGSSEQGKTITASRFVKKKPDTFQTKVLKEAIPEKYSRFSQGIISVAEGTQDFALIATDWGQADLNSFAAESYNSNKRFWVDSVSQQGVITNTTSTPIKITLYSLKLKKDGNATPIELIKSGIAAKYNGSQTQYQVPFTSPRESESFINRWKIIDEKTITLSPGENHQYYYKHEIEKYYNSNEYIERQNATNWYNTTYYKNFTKAIMVKILPTIVTDSTKVSFAASKICFVNRSNLSYKRPQGPNGIEIKSTQASVPQNGLTIEKYINEDTGDVDTNVTI